MTQHCESVSKDGTRCVYMQRHRGKHAGIAGLRGAVFWEDPLTPTVRGAFIDLARVNRLIGWTGFRVAVGYPEDKTMEEGPLRLGIVWWGWR